MWGGGGCGEEVGVGRRRWVWGGGGGCGEEEVGVGRRRWVWGGGGCGEEDKIGRILDWVFRIGLSCTLKFSIT